MTDSAPSILLYAQAAVLLKKLQDDYTVGAIRSVEDLSKSLRDVLSRYEESAGTPFLKFEPVAEGEPPRSSKMNDTWNSLQHDVNILQDQVDILRAAAVFTHNFVATEIVKSEQANARVDNKLKTLQLYSNSTDSTIITFGDSFKSADLMDKTFSPENSPTITDGVLHLGQIGQLKNLSLDSVVTILPNSNGFVGNSQEITDPSDATRDPVTNELIYHFRAEQNRAQDTKFIIDGLPNQWFEYENYLVSNTDRLTAGNMGFTYQTTTATGATQVDWALGPSGRVLKLSLQFDLGVSKKVNYIAYTPYGLENNRNYPVLIKQVRISTNGTDWELIFPQNVWVGTDPNLQAARTADNVTTGAAVWPFSEKSARYVRVDIEQAQPVTTNVGHIYYVDKDTKNRVAGPVPPIENPARYYDPSSLIYGNAIQKREFFVAKRWAIGIRDLLIQQLQYQVQSIWVTTPLRIGGIVDRVTLEADIYVPPEFPSTQSWVNFYVSPNDGTDWYQISRIQDDYLNIPEEIAFNDPLPPQFHEPGVAYYNTGTAVTALRFKIVLSRPEDVSTSTPLVRSYRLKVKKR